MRHSTFFAGLLLGAATLTPASVWANTDCGNPPVKTAEVVYTIQTPEQIAPTRVETDAPIQAQPVQIAPVITTPAATVVTTPPAARVETVQTAEAAAPTANTPTSAFEAILERRISRGEGGLNLFDYAGAKAAGEGVAIKAYTDYLASQNPDSLSQNDQIAYWANLYNALTVNLILDNYPVTSIRKIKAGTFSTGPWKRDEVTVNGKVLSLNDIEHEILRKKYPNPALVHYMVNCASIGCPNLQPKLWNGATLDADRDAAAREFINSPRGVKINGKKLKASEIYSWFKADFGTSKSSQIEHFRKYAGPELRAALDAGAKIDGYGYDWDLNE